MASWFVRRKGQEHEFQTSCEMACRLWQQITGKWKGDLVLRQACRCIQRNRFYVAKISPSPVPLFLSYIIQSGGCSCCAAGRPFAASATIYGDPKYGFCFSAGRRREVREGHRSMNSTDVFRIVKETQHVVHFRSLCLMGIWKAVNNNNNKVKTKLSLC